MKLIETELASHSDPAPAKIIQAARQQMGPDLQASSRTITILEIRPLNNNEPAR